MRIVYYLPGTAGWGASYDGPLPPTGYGLPTALWNPQAQTSGASFGVKTNQFGFNLTGSSGMVIVVEGSTNLMKLVANIHQHAYPRHVLFQRSELDELSRPLLPPPLAVGARRL